MQNDECMLAQMDKDGHTHIHGQGSGITRRVHNILVQLHGLGYYDKEMAGTRVQ